MTHSHDVFLWHVTCARFPCCLLEERISLLHVGENHLKDRKMPTLGGEGGLLSKIDISIIISKKLFFPG